MAKRKVSHPQETQKSDPQQPIAPVASTINFTLEEFEQLRQISCGLNALTLLTEGGTNHDMSGGDGFEYLCKKTARHLDNLYCDISEREKFDEKQDAAEGGAE